MGKAEVFNKLFNKLKAIPTSEEDVVYILSKVRKLLEMEGYPKEYRLLKFYCDFALHIKIDRPPKEICDDLEKRLSGITIDPNSTLIAYMGFHTQFDKFLTEKKLPNIYKQDNRAPSKINLILTAIYLNTPVITKVDTNKYEMTIDEKGITSYPLE